MAGSSSQFNADLFRSSIQAAMQMGASNQIADQVTFVWLEKDVYAPEAPDNSPFSWTAPIVSATPGHTYVQVNCAVEYAGMGGEGSPMGELDVSHVTLTLLDQDYANVVGADQVLINDYVYLILPPGPIRYGLFDVDVVQVRCVARA